MNGTKVVEIAEQEVGYQETPKGSNKTYKIYSLASSENPEIVRYIGYTSKEQSYKRLQGHTYESKRARKLNLKCSYKINWVNSILDKGFEIIQEIIEDDIFSKERAYIKEIEYIKLFKSFGAKLVNGTLGGVTGNYNKKTNSRNNEQTREKIRNTLMGHVVTQETRVKLSIAHKGKIGPWAGKQKTKEQITNIKKIYQYSLEGEFIKEWENSKDIADNFNCKSHYIRKCCLGLIKTAKGFIWKYNLN